MQRRVAKQNFSTLIVVENKKDNILGDLYSLTIGGESYSKHGLFTIFIPAKTLSRWHPSGGTTVPPGSILLKQKFG